MGVQAATVKVSTRSCGGCTACCKTHANLQFQKPTGVWCTHCKVGAGCGIYGSHPAECQDFKCLWLLGEFPDSHRPDRLKIVSDFRQEQIPGRTIIVVRLWEVSPDALQKPEAQKIVRAALNSRFVVMQRTLLAGGRYRDTMNVPENFMTAQELVSLIKILGHEQED